MFHISPAETHMSALAPVQNMFPCLWRQLHPYDIEVILCAHITRGKMETAGGLHTQPYESAFNTTGKHTCIQAQSQPRTGFLVFQHILFMWFQALESELGSLEHIIALLLHV